MSTTPEPMEPVLSAYSPFERTDPLHGMTVADVARLLNIPAGPTPYSAYGAYGAGEDGWPVLGEPALHGLAGDVVRAIEPESESDPTAILMQFMVAFGNVIGTGPHCLVESSRHGLNLFCVLVGQSSKARKGTSWNHIRAIFQSVDPDWAANRVTDGLSSAEGLINEVRDQRAADDLEAVADKRLLVVQGEFASVLRVMAREGNNLSPVLRNAWDGGTLRTMVKHDPLKATSAHISMIGHITTRELLKYLSDNESHNGFANRLLWVCVRRSKFLPDGGRVPTAAIEELSRRTAEAVRWARQARGELRRDESARELWRVVYPQLSDGLPGLLGAATGRAEAQVLRLSAIYAALDRSPFVGLDHLRAALAVWDYVFASARLIFSDASGDAVADRIREALQAAGPDGLSRSAIRNMFMRHVSSERISKALTLLAGLGVAASTTVETQGRPIEVWRLARKAPKATKGDDE